MAAAAQFGLSGSVNDTVSAQGITPKPQVLDACFAIVDNYVDNKHAWTEADVSNPDNVVAMVGGRRGKIDTDGSGSGGGTDDQVAWALDGSSYDIGTIIYIVRINYNGWGIVGASSGPVGSGSGNNLTITCGDGSVHSVTIHGNSITVGD